MMMGPGAYVNEHENDTLEEMIEERDRLISEIKQYENKGRKDAGIMRQPSPEMIYQFNHLYLSEICNMIYEKGSDK